MQPNGNLETMIARERYRAILRALSPGELAVVALRLDGLSYASTAHLLGVSRQAVNQRMRSARRKVRCHVPDVRTRVSR